jgi:hypothetical protein
LLTVTEDRAFNCCKRDTHDAFRDRGLIHDAELHADDVVANLELVDSVVSCRTVASSIGNIQITVDILVCRRAVCIVCPFVNFSCTEYGEY